MLVALVNPVENYLQWWAIQLTIHSTAGVHVDIATMNGNKIM